MRLNINSNAIVKHAATLERLHRSALPVAVRQTLNSAAFDVKQHTMPAQAKKTFAERDKNFFKANSKVAPATGFAINTMRATVGFVPLGGTNQAVDDLDAQEYGGKIDGRTFIPLAQARSANSWGRKPRRNARISQIRGKIVDSARGRGTSKKQQFITSAIHAGVGGWVLGNHTNAAGNRILYRVTKIERRGGNTVVKITPQFAVKSGRQVRPKATAFMQKSSLKSAEKMEQFFIQHAEKQIQKYRK